jgi:hypothetical protein
MRIVFSVRLRLNIVGKFWGILHSKESDASRANPERSPSFNNRSTLLSKV